MKYILVAIDGTDSKKWRQTESHGYSHIADWAKKFRSKGQDFSSMKKYFHGPNLAGTNNIDILNFSYRFVLRALKSFNIPMKSSDISRTQSELRIILVGHSRGAAIVTCLAEKIYKKFQIKPYFIGLYDSVDRAYNLNPGNPAHYSTHIYHAKRAKYGSRRSFGNTGDNEEVGQHSFETSHGGIGGAPVFRRSITGDNSCADIKDLLRCYQESNKAHKYILKYARRCHIPI